MRYKPGNIVEVREWFHMFQRMSRYVVLVLGEFPAKEEYWTLVLSDSEFQDDVGKMLHYSLSENENTTCTVL